jgi:hypothetical protein
MMQSCVPIIGSIKRMSVLNSVCFMAVPCDEVRGYHAKI